MDGAVVVGPDSFKDTLTATEVAEAVAAGVEDAGRAAVRLPLADGGEGTAAALVAALGGESVPATVSDPLGRPVDVAWTRLGGAGVPVAVVETAAASGLGLVAAADRDAWAASTAGTGELIAAAVVEGGARRVLIAVGGSATTDGGAGALAALVAAGVLGDPAVELVLLCDVRVPFERAAEVFGPQKGADPALVARLAARLDDAAGRLPRDPRGVARTGAAGGLAGGLWAHGARLVDGAAFVADAAGLDRHLAVASSCVTGEGALDAQTAQGKLVAHVAARARAAGVACHAVVGRRRLGASGVAALGLASVVEAGTRTALRAAGRRLASR